MRSGTIKWFDEDKGYGFIVPSDGGEDVFVRRDQLDEAGIGAVSEGTALNFDVQRTSDGLQATQLSLAD